MRRGMPRSCDPARASTGSGGTLIQINISSFFSQILYSYLELLYLLPFGNVSYRLLLIGNISLIWLFQLHEGRRPAAGPVRVAGSTYCRVHRARIFHAVRCDYPSDGSATGARRSKCGGRSKIIDPLWADGSGRTREP